jgi:hypothetical protein
MGTSQAAVATGSVIRVFPKRLPDYPNNDRRHRKVVWFTPNLGDCERLPYLTDTQVTAKDFDPMSNFFRPSRHRSFLYFNPSVWVFFQPRNVVDDCSCYAVTRRRTLVFKSPRELEFDISPMSRDDPLDLPPQGHGTVRTWIRVIFEQRGKNPVITRLFRYLRSAVRDELDLNHRRPPSSGKGSWAIGGVVYSRKKATCVVPVASPSDSM